MSDKPLKRDQLIALMVAERDSERRGSGRVVALEWADVVNRQTRAVELIAADDAGEIAIEHTRVESYSHQIEDKIAVSHVFAKHGPEILDRFEAGYMRVSVKPGAMAALPPSSFAQVAEILTSWVTKNIDTLIAQRRAGQQNLLVGAHPDVPFEWSMWQAFPFEMGDFIGPNARVAQIDYLLPGDLEQQRASRLQHAMTRKVPKLLAAAWNGRRSLLVIEDRGSVFGAPAYISTALQVASEGHAMPDAVYLFQSGRGNPLLLAIYDGGHWAHDDAATRGYEWLTFSDARSSDYNMLAFEDGWA